MSSANALPKELCLWQSKTDNASELTAAGSAQPPVIEGEEHCDVAIVGGGYTGLWTALFLKQLAPQLDIRLLEARHCGHGASGRNGGWLMGSVEGLHRFTNSTGQLSPQIRAVLGELVTDATETIAALGIDCDLAHGGAVMGAARYPEQLERARQLMADLTALGFSEDDYRWLDAEQTTARVSARGMTGGVYTPHVATLNPWKLVRGLAEAAIAQGITIYEHTPALAIQPHRVQTAQGTLAAAWVVVATEGYSGPESPVRNHLLPVQSGMVATEPLDHSQWQELGFEQREAFSDFSRASTYLQRTADNRLVVGARGSYKLGRRCQHDLAANQRDTVRRIALARQLFPALTDVPFTHAWSGTLGIPRQFAPHLVIDQKQGLATAGGYVGEGVGASFLFGWTLAELITGNTSIRTQMPWIQRGNVGDALRRWEPEPLPWLGFYTTMAAFDLEERWRCRSG